MFGGNLGSFLYGDIPVMLKTVSEAIITIYLSLQFILAISSKKNQWPHMMSVFEESLVFEES